MTNAHNLILQVNRPQYVSVPEGFISALAWKVFESSDVEPKDGGKPIALMFKVKKATTKTVDLRTTAPEGTELRGYGEHLVKSGIATNLKNYDDLAAAVVNSVAGVQAEKSANQAASPITAGFALMQNMRGVQRTKNPPDLAEVLEALFNLGLAADESSSGVARLWLDAADHRRKIDDLLRIMDDATRQHLFADAPRERLFDSDSGREPGLGLFAGTPFSWFAGAWKKLTSPEWVEALPSRVWVDWATTILRLALGQGFLWEAAWYETIARRVLASKPTTWLDLRGDIPEILPWKSSRSSVGVRDVAPLLLWRIHRGAAIRKILMDWFSSEGRSELQISDAFRDMCQDHNLTDDLTAALGSRQRTAVNIWEAVRYALMTRDASGPFADYYGLLRSNGRYLTVEPGTEWMAVVASLACGTPGATSDVATLMLDLEELGLRPELGDLISLLEKAGLARGSADADQGVLIQSAF